MKTYATQSGRNLNFKKNDNKMMRMIFKAGCPSEVYCAKLPKQETWKLRK